MSAEVARIIDRELLTEHIYCQAFLGSRAIHPLAVSSLALSSFDRRSFDLALLGGKPQQFARNAGVRIMISGSPDFILPGQGVDHAPEFQELETPEGELHLRFYVPSGNEFALPATGIREVLSPSPDRMTPIPNVSSLLLGTLNMRGRVIWVADLGQFLGDQTPLNTDRPEIPIVAVEDQDTILGLAVDRIVGMDWLDAEQLHSQNNAPDGMIPFLRGEWMLGEPDPKVLRLLDQVKILRSARWAA